MSRIVSEDIRNYSYHKEQVIKYTVHVIIVSEEKITC